MSTHGGCRIILYLVITIYYLIPRASSQSPEVCPPPGGIANGRARTSGPYYNGSELVYDCDEGYMMSDNAIAKCEITNDVSGNTTTKEFKPEITAKCELPPPIDYRHTINNTYEGLPEWLAVLGAVLMALLFLMSLACLLGAMWYMCCRGAAGGCNCFGRGSSGMTSSNHMYNTYDTSNNVTSVKTPPAITQDAGTQVRLHQSGGDYNNDYPQKQNATYTKVEYVTHGGAPSTSGAKEPVWMPHARPPRNDIYHLKSSTK